MNSTIDSSSSLLIPLMLGTEPLWLVSAWKPLLMLPPLLAWAWVISTIYDKDAERWHFARETWNLGHMAAGLASIAVVVFVPLTIWITLPLMIVILVADLAVYYAYRNKHEMVPVAVRWSLDPSELFAKEKEKKQRKKAPKGTIRLVIRGKGGEMEIPEPETPEFEIRVNAETLLMAAMEQRASQLDIGPVKEGVYGASISVHGVKTALPQMAAPQALAAMDYLKKAAGLDVSDRRRKQKGDMEVGPAATTTLPVSVTTLGGSSGMRLTLLFDPVRQVSMRIDDLGLHKEQLKALRTMITEDRGVVLLAAPADEGRTATMYAVLREHDAYTSNVQTVEKDPQSMIEGVRHNVHDLQKDGGEYSTLVRSILRRDPDVVGVTDLEEDQNTAKEVARADYERTRVYLSVRTDDPLKAIQIFCHLVGDPKQAAKCLRGVVAQRLVRRLCNNCKVAFQPTPEILKKLGLPPEVRELHRKGGRVLVKDKEEECPVCAGLGFTGQVGAFAVHPLNEEERGLIASGELNALRAMFRQKKELSIQQAALQHVILGNTSIEEVVRIATPKSAGTKKPGASATESAEKQPARG